MLPRAIRGQHSASLTLQTAAVRFYSIWPATHTCTNALRQWSASFLVTTGSCATNIDIHAISTRRAYSSASDRPADVEREIWEHIQRGNFGKAVSLSCQARRRRRAEEPPLSLLIQFALTKRQFQVECLYAGIYASLHALEQNTLLTTDDFLIFFAALLADRDPGLLEIYKGLPSSKQRAIDIALAGSMAFYYLKLGKQWQTRWLWAHLPIRSKVAVKWAVQNPGQLARAISSDYAQLVHAACMLRRPSGDFNDVKSAGKLVEALFQAGIIPDQSVLETLVTSSVRVGHVAAALAVYASRHWPRGLPHSMLVGLVDIRTTMALSAPRVHYDVIGASVRANDLHSVLVATSALRSRKSFHFAISLWATHCEGNWKGVVELTKLMLRSLTCSLLHSTHHLVLSAMLDMARPARCSPSLVNVILSNTLALHWVLAPRLESPSVAAVHQLMRALIDHGMSESAFQVYRDFERRPKWTRPESTVSSDAILAVLAGELARREDIRSIMHLAGVATRHGVLLSAHFYTAVICGLTMSVKRIVSSGTHQHSIKSDHGRYSQPALGPSSSGYDNSLQRIQTAESLFDSMRRNKIDAPTKVYHALMYAWALLGQPRRVQGYFDKLERRAKGGAMAATSGTSEIAWGILLYSHARAHDVQGTLGVLARAREWVSGLSTDDLVIHSKGGIARTSGRTSYLVNISVCALLVDRNSRSALSLLDACISRYDEALQIDDSQAGSRKELPATPADPVTRSLIIRALLDHQQLAQAVEVHNSIHAQYSLPEYASELKPMLKFCLGQNDTSSALQIAARILQIGGASALTDSQWIRLLRLCIEERKGSAVADLLSDLGAQDSERGGFTAVVAPMLRSKFPEAIEWISRVLKENGWDNRTSTTAVTLEVGDSSMPAAEPTQPPEASAQCMSLYRGLLRAIREFPLAEMRGKLKYNARFCFELYRDLEPHNPKIQQLIDDGRRQLQWLGAWKHDPETCQKLVHKPLAK